MLGLIMAVAMVPGLLIGLQRTTAIDYDAVAYRTGAILAEDPGCIVNEPTGFCTVRDWENRDINTSGGRLGLAAMRGSQNILSPYKIEKFNDSEYISYPEGYRGLMIFGDYPYRFNITLVDEDNTPRILNHKMDPIPESANYGYIKRAVKIKGDTRFEIDLNASYARDYNVTCYNCSDVTQMFKVQVDIKEIENINQFVNPLFQFKTLNEPIIITITNFSSKFNWSVETGGFFNCPKDALGKSNCSISHPDHPGVPRAANFSMWNDMGYQPERATFNATLEKILFYDLKDDKENDINAYPDDKIFLTIINTSSTDPPMPPHYLNSIQNIIDEQIFDNYTFSLTIPPESLFIAEDSILEIRFIFKDTIPMTLINGMHQLNSTAVNAIQSETLNGWLEVAVW